MDHRQRRRCRHCCGSVHPARPGRHGPFARAHHERLGAGQAEHLDVPPQPADDGVPGLRGALVSAPLNPVMWVLAQRVERGDDIRGTDGVLLTSGDVAVYSVRRVIGGYRATIAVTWLWDDPNHEW